MELHQLPNLNLLTYSCSANVLEVPGVWLRVLPAVGAEEQRLALLGGRQGGSSPGQAVQVNHFSFLNGALRESEALLCQV